MEQVKLTLQQMVRDCVIAPVEKHTLWCSPMLTREKKDGSLRICLDPHNLNDALERTPFPLPDFDSITAQLSGMTTFSKIDLNSGFWQLPLDEASSDLCTFSTPFGRFKFLCLFFEASPAPEIFHLRYSRAFQAW
jgi:hypothetical protein